MLNVEDLREGVFVELMEDDSKPDIWVSGIITSVKKQTIFVKVRGNAPKIIAKTSKYRKESEDEKESDDFEKMSRKELEKVDHEAIIDLDTESHKIRLQV